MSQRPFIAEEGNGIPPQYILPTTQMDTTNNEVGPFRLSSHETPIQRYKCWMMPKKEGTNSEVKAEAQV